MAKKPYHLDLAPDFEGDWIEIRDPKYMSQRQFTELTEQSTSDNEAFIRAMAQAWHITDPDGNVLSDPKADKLEDIPAGVVKALADTLQDLFTATTPKGSRTP